MKPKNMTEAHNGDKHWKISHLPDHMRNEKLFSKKVMPHALKKLGMLDPWVLLMVEMVQDIIDEVFAEKKGKKDYKVEADNVWYRLVCLYHMLFIC